MQPSVLLVGDLADVRLCVRRVLEDADYVVTEARDAATAAAVLRTSPERSVVVLTASTGMPLLWTAMDEPAVGRHAFVLLAAHPASLTTPSRQLLDALGVPTVTNPCDLATLFRAIEGSARRLASPASQPLPV